MTRYRRITEVVVLSLALAAPALAGGPEQKPDGVGNPSGADYTGYTSVYMVLGVRENTDQRTRFTCYNPSKEVGDWAVQLWTGADSPGRTPVADSREGTLPLSDVDSINTDSMNGTASAVGTSGVAKIIAIDAGGKGKPKVICRAQVENKSDDSTAAELTVIPFGGKETKPKDTK